MRVAASMRFLFFSSLVIFVSCQKEVSFDNAGQGPGPGGSGGGTNNSITGDYDFVGMSAHTSSTVTVNQAGQEIKAVTVSDYTSKNNTGTVKITSNQIITDNFSYSIDTMVNTKTYINGVLFDDSDFPFAASAPATSNTSPYVRNSNDSLTVTGAFGVSPDPSGNTPTGPVGVKLSWHGDTLWMKVATTINQTITQGGVPANFSGTVNGITKLKKR